MVTTTSSPVTEARERLQALLAEQASLPTAINAARRAVHVEEWLRLQNRDVDLPTEIRAARIAVTRLELQKAWDAAEAAHEQEVAAMAAFRAEQAAVDRLNDRLRRTLPASEADAVDRRADSDRARLAESAADRAYRAAQDATGLALARVDELSEQLVELTGEPVVDPAGACVRTGPLVSTIVVGPAQYGALADRLGTVTGAPDGPHVMLAGTTPPRWVAHRVSADLLLVDEAS